MAGPGGWRVSQVSASARLCTARLSKITWRAFAFGHFAGDGVEETDAVLVRMALHGATVHPGCDVVGGLRRSMLLQMRTAPLGAKPVAVGANGDDVAVVEQPVGPVPLFLAQFAAVRGGC